MPNNRMNRIVSLAGHSRLCMRYRISISKSRRFTIGPLFNLEVK